MFGLPFLLMDAWITIGRFVMDSALRRRMRYAMTDQWVLIDRRGWFATRRELDGRRLPVLKLDECADGIGTIRFGLQSGWSGANGFGIWAPMLDPTPQFLPADDAHTVDQLIRRELS